MVGTRTWPLLLLCCSALASPVPTSTTTYIPTTDIGIFLESTTDVPASWRVRGWVEEPNVRGSFEILWTSLVTIFLCTHSMLILNMAAPNDTQWAIARRRVLWMAIAILGPEFPLTFAAGQWSRACQSVMAFKSLGGRWTMRHAFFADMGGFVLCPRDSKPFPLNTKQLLWLVVNKKVERPLVTAEELWDRSKQTRLVRVIMSVQTGYFVVQCIARVQQGLAVTTLELNTLAIVVCSLITNMVWLHKPSEVSIPIKITTPFSSEELCGGQQWQLTPLDFVDENGPGYSVNIQPFMRMPVINSERPIQRIPNDRFPTDPHGCQEYSLCFATLVFTAVHVAGWRIGFPSRIEETLWRASSLLLFGITAVFWVLETIASWFRLGRWERLYLRLFAKGRLPEFERRQLRRRQTADTKPKAPLPQPWEFWTITPLAVIYGIARMYLIVEAFLEFRNMPASAFLNVRWSAYIPHA